MKTYILFIALLTLISCTKKQKQGGDIVVLKVNDSKLMASDFATYLSHELKDYNLLAVKDEKIITRAKAEVVRKYIVRVVTRDWARKQGLFVRKEHIDQQVAKIRESYPDDLTFRRALIEENLSFNFWKTQLKFSLLQKKVSQQLFERAAADIDEKELKNYYKTHKNKYIRPERAHLRQILLDTKNNARRIEQELKQGKSFKDLAKKFSIAPEAVQSGDLGWIEKGTLSVFDKAFDLRPGRRSKVIKSPYGYHIIQMIKKQPSKTIPFKQVREKIIEELVAKKEQVVYSKWLEEQIRKSKVYKNEIIINNISVETHDHQNH